MAAFAAVDRSTAGIAMSENAAGSRWRPFDCLWLLADSFGERKLRLLTTQKRTSGVQCPLTVRKRS